MTTIFGWMAASVWTKFSLLLPLNAGLAIGMAGGEIAGLPVVALAFGMHIPP